MPVLRLRSVPAAPEGPAPARPLVVAEPPDVPVRELEALPPSAPDADPGPLAPGTPAEPVADLLATPGTRAERDEEGGVVQRTEASPAGRPTAAADTAALPLAAPRTGTAAGQGPDAAPTAPLVGGTDGAEPAVQPVVQRDVTAPPRPRHRGLGEPLAALPPTAVPLPGPPAPPAGSAVSPSVASEAQVSRTVEVPWTPAAPQDPPVPHAPPAPAPLDAAGSADPGVPSSDGEGTAPLLGDAPPLTTDPVDLGTGLSPETATGSGADAVEVGPVSVPSGPGTFPLGPGAGPDAGSGPVTGSGGAAPLGPVAVQRLDAPGGSPDTPSSTGATPVLAEAGRAPLLGDAGPLGVSDTVVREAPGPGEMVTASTPMPVRRLDAVNAVDAATLPGAVPEAGAGAGSAARGTGPVSPLVAQRSLPLFTVPEPGPSAEATVASEPPVAVPVRWEPVGGGASVSGAGGSGGHAPRAGGSGGHGRSADAAADGFGGPGDHGGPRDGHTPTGGGSAYPGAGAVSASGDAGGVVQRIAGTGAVALAHGAPSAWSSGDTALRGVSGIPGLPGLPDVSRLPGSPEPFGGSGAGAFGLGGARQPFTRGLQGPGALGPAVPLQRLPEAPGAAPPPTRRAVPPVPPTPSPQGRTPSDPTLPGVSAGAAAVAAGVARWMPDGSVEFTAPAVQRAEDGTPVTEPPADPPAQGEPADPPAPPAGAEAPDAAGGSSTPAAGPGKAGGAGGAGAPKVTDELVRALVAPLSRLLKAELRIERERAGSLINLRH
ncbi:hypothetical protein [Streptomyces sp. A012304]|uniref:hypothetical protein n=1 Tax=Streptomyces sp. A012304 TaxID=375446 RepID=UPI00222E8E69|nr:hypothetical protein [Streptomyces sp. A012304]